MPNNSAMDTLKNLLGDNAEEKIQNVLSSLSSEAPKENLPAVSEPPVNTAPSVSDNGGLEYVMRIKGIIDELGHQNNDSRSNLLLSLKPFMRGSRQQSIDSAVRLLNLTKLTSLFKL